MWESLGKCANYIKGTANIIIAIPAKSPTCQYCQMIGYQQAFDRHYCRINGEWILNYKKGRGENCPVEWEGEQ